MTTIGDVPVLNGAEFNSSMLAKVDERTRAIVERRRHAPIVRRRGWLVRRALLTADIVGLVGGFATTEVLAGLAGHGGHLNAIGETLLFTLTVPAWVVVAKMYGLYDRDEERTDHSTADDLPGVFHMVTVGTWIVFVCSWASGLIEPEWTKLVTFWILAVSSISVLRSLARAACRRHVAYLQNTLIVGGGQVGQLIARKLLAHPEYGLNLVGFIDGEPCAVSDDLDHLCYLGTPEQLAEIVEFLDVERVIFGFAHQRHEEEIVQLRELNRMGVQVDLVPRLFERIGPGMSLHHVEGIPLLGLPPTRLGRFSLGMKRALDLVGAGAMLLVCAPLLAVIAVAVAATSRGCVIYRDKRIGRSGSVFVAYKFRTMRIDARELLEDLLHRDRDLHREFDRTHKLVADPRVTQVGAFLRRWSLDELPQLVNVIKGDVSLVGPRPITCFEYERFQSTLDPGEEYYWESDLRPGLTGYWQISGRSSMSYAERVRLDRAYTGGWSLGLDMMILAKTIRVIFSQRGAA